MSWIIGAAIVYLAVGLLLLATAWLIDGKRPKASVIAELVFCWPKSLLELFRL